MLKWTILFVFKIYILSFLSQIQYTIIFDWLPSPTQPLHVYFQLQISCTSLELGSGERSCYWQTHKNSEGRYFKAKDQHSYWAQTIYNYSAQCVSASFLLTFRVRSLFVEGGGGGGCPIFCIRCSRLHSIYSRNTSSTSTSPQFWHLKMSASIAKRLGAKSSLLRTTALGTYQSHSYLIHVCRGEALASR